MAQTEFRKKLENFWFYYKLQTIIGSIFLIFIIVSVTQCALRTKPDFTLVIVSGSNFVSDAQQQTLKNQIQQYVPDYNKDGKRTVNIVSIDLTQGTKNPSYTTSMRGKLQEELQLPEVIDFLIDDNAYSQLSSVGIFDKIESKISNAPLTDDFRIPVKKLSAFNDKNAFPLTGNYYLAFRIYKGTLIDKPSNQTYYNNCIDILQRIVDNKKI